MYSNDGLIEDLIDLVVFALHERRDDELLPVLNQAFQTLFLRLLVAHAGHQDLHVAVRALKRSLERFDGDTRQLAREIGGDFGTSFTEQSENRFCGSRKGEKGKLSSLSLKMEIKSSDRERSQVCRFV